MKKKDLYNQTVSKADQIALCSYIRDGHLDSQIRKSRKIYAQKSKILTDLLIEKFCEKVTILKTNSPLYVRCRFNINTTTKALCELAEKSGILLIPASTNDKYPEVAFSVATVGQNRLENAVTLLEKVIGCCE
jgi:GntR family transcriptional regulator/MocR family aminotransferase